jgi:hypothetical protein
MLDDILEEFSPKEVITIVIERRWKYRNPTKIVKQLWEIPVLVIRNTGKAILVTKEGGSSWADGKKDEAIWLPSFAMTPTGDRKYKVRYDKINGMDFTRFVKKYGYKPVKELEESFTIKSFSEFLEEKEVVMTPAIRSAKMAVDEFLSSFGRSNYNEYLMSDIEDGVKNAVNAVFAQVEKDIEILIKKKVFPELVKRYNLLHDAYLAKEREYQTILTCVKVGETQETAVKKLSKMSKTLKYFNLESMKVTTHYFDPMSEDDILEEIEKFNGQVKMRGAMDFFVEFRNGKVSRAYYF